jgi:hypothetical protein
MMAEILRMRRLHLVAVMFYLFLCSRHVSAQDLTALKPCRDWDKRIDASLGASGVQVDNLLTERERIEAIACLLKHRGDKRPARFGGATNLSVSQILPSATVDLASLYYVSYLFTGNWQHADGIALWNRDGVMNPPGSVDLAYASYIAWFQRVKSMGISEARKQGLDPLEGTGLHWYGK